MTCNPQCPAIKANLQGCPLQYHSDLVSKTFILDINQIMNILYSTEIIGQIYAYSGVIEHPKLGLFHLHLLAILWDEDVP